MSMPSPLRFWLVASPVMAILSTFDAAPEAMMPPPPPMLCATRPNACSPVVCTFSHDSTPMWPPELFVTGAEVQLLFLPTPPHNVRSKLGFEPFPATPTLLTLAVPPHPPYRNSVV